MEHNNELQTVLIETAVKKLNEQNSMLEQIKEQTGKAQDLSEQLKFIRNEINLIKKGDLFSQVLTQEIKAIKTPLKNVSQLLNKPQEQTTIHHHHFPKLVWITVALLFLSVFLIMGWKGSAEKLESYMVNDNKYRFLHLQEGKTLHAKLKWVDSLYRIRPNMIDSVNNLEEDRNIKIELLREALEMEKQAKQIRKNVHQQSN